VKWMDDVLKIALERMPEPLVEPIVENTTQTVTPQTPSVSISAH
jgi:hypothetical protein